MRTFCHQHPAREAAYRCIQCAKPICERCTFNARFCSRPCNDQYSEFRKAGAGPGRRAHGMPWRLIFWTLLAFGTAYAGWAYQNGTLHFPPTGH